MRANWRAPGKKSALNCSFRVVFNKWGSCMLSAKFLCVGGGFFHIK
jgi:hypothetical protein